MVRSKSRQSIKSSSEYNDKNEYTNDIKAIKKVKKLLETDNPVPIIEKIKSYSYIQKILKSTENRLLYLTDEKKNRKYNVIIELEKRRSVIKELLKKKEEIARIARNKEELKELITKLKRLQTKLEKLRADKPHYKADFMDENSKNTREKLENAKRILEANPSDVKYLEYIIYDIELYIELQERTIRGLKEQICSRILTPKQVGPICWFMATFVAMFYSQRNRKVLLNASKRWDKKDKLFTLLKQVLDDKYLKSDNEKEDYEKFSDDTFGNILTLLFEKDPKSFPYNPKLEGAFNTEIYIGKLYNLLGIDYKMYDYANSSILAYSYYNMEYDIFKYTYEEGEYGRHIDKQKHIYTYIKDTSTPTILIIRVCDKGFFKRNIIYDETMKKELTSMSEYITYNDKTYILDSVILSDDNFKHAITGITCKGIKYIYNGWTRASMDPAMVSQAITREIPCELQQHDWNVEGQGDDFCLNTITCLPDILSKDKLANEKRLCFNFSEGDRLLIYVLKDKHLEKLNKAATTLQATMRRRSVA